MKFRMGAVAALASLAVLAMPASRASAQEGQEGESRQPQQQSVHVGESKILGATVKGPDIDEPRRWDQSHAENFTRTWFGTWLLGPRTREDPPEDAPIYHVEIEMRDPAGVSSTMLVDYAARDETAWIRLPIQEMAWGRVDVEQWLRAPAGTVAAFDEANASGSQEPASEATRETREPFPWTSIGVVALFVLGALGLALVVNRTRRRPPAEGPRSPGRKHARV